MSNDVKVMSFNISDSASDISVLRGGRVSSFTTPPPPCSFFEYFKKTSFLFQLYVCKKMLHKLQLQLNH